MQAMLLELAYPDSYVPIRPTNSRSAFAFWLYGGRVITWGDEEYGGDCSDVQDQL